MESGCRMTIYWGKKGSAVEGFLAESQVSLERALILLVWVLAAQMTYPHTAITSVSTISTCPCKNETLSSLRGVAMRVRKKKNYSPSEDQQPPLCGPWRKKQRHSWKEHIGQPQVCCFLNHPEGWNIWETNKNAVVQLGNVKTRKISELRLLLYSCPVGSLAGCELHNHTQYLSGSSCIGFYQVFVITWVLSVDGF